MDPCPEVLAPSPRYIPFNLSESIQSPLGDLLGRASFPYLSSCSVTRLPQATRPSPQPSPKPLGSGAATNAQTCESLKGIWDGFNTASPKTLSPTATSGQIQFCCCIERMHVPNFAAQAKAQRAHWQLAAATRSCPPPRTGLSSQCTIE